MIVTVQSVCSQARHEDYTTNRNVRTCIQDKDRFTALIFVVPCIMLSSEIIPTRCNNCVYSSQWLYSTYQMAAFVLYSFLLVFLYW